MKKQFNYKLLFAVFLLFVAGWTTAQDFDTSKTINKTTAVPKNVRILMDNQSGDLKIVTTNENTVSIKTEIDVSGPSKENVEKVISAVADFAFNLHGEDLEINTRFYKNLVATNNRKTITLLNGEKVRIGEFSIRHELQIPQKARIELTNKYSDIEMQSFEGDARFDLYSSNLYAGSFAKNVSIDSKYSKIKMQDISQKAVFNFYDTDIAFNSCGDANIESQYSKFEAAKTGTLSIDSYDDKFYFDYATNINLKARYSDFVSKAKASDVLLDLYDCNFKIESAQYVTYSGKYSEMEINDAKEFKITSSYDDNIQLTEVGKLEVKESKYGKYRIGNVAAFTIDGYNDAVTIASLPSHFSEINMVGKYGKLTINAGKTPFRVNFNIRYPKVDIPESIKIIKQTKEDSELQLIGGESGGTISVEGYDMKVVVN